MVFLTNCESNQPIKVEAGSIENGVYFNAFFNLQLQIPEQWIVEILGEIEIEGDSLIKDNTNSQFNAEKQKVLMANLITIFKENKDDSFKPNLAIIVEHNSRYPNFKNEIDYLSQIKKQYENVHATFSEIKKMKLKNNIECQTLNNTLVINDLKMKQTHYTLIRNSYFMDVIITYTNDIQKEELTSIVNSLQFKN